MTGFSTAWLALREAADHRSRDAGVANALQSHYLQRERIGVIDLGCGTGSNLRATSALLPKTQNWTLVDYDNTLLAAARTALQHWADTHDTQDDALVLVKGSTTITVRFRQADLTTGLDAILDGTPGIELVTASALFDLASEDFIKRFTAAIARRRLAFYTVLTYNGIQRWTPRSPLDQAMNAAFHKHQLTDKGFGASAGPTAPIHLAEQLELHGYSVIEGDSPWRLGPADTSLVKELASGFAAAVQETKALSGSEIDGWLKRVHTGAEVGHTDTLALPGQRLSNALDIDDA